MLMQSLVEVDAVQEEDATHVVVLVVEAPDVMVVEEVLVVVMVEEELDVDAAMDVENQIRKMNPLVLQPQRWRRRMKKICRS